MAQAYDVVIKGTGMGIGEQVLIDNLMNAFIHTLAQRENLPTHIIFYGEGVKLTSKGSGCLADLQEYTGHQKHQVPFRLQHPESLFRIYHILLCS